MVGARGVTPPRPTLMSRPPCTWRSRSRGSNARKRRTTSSAARSTRHRPDVAALRRYLLDFCLVTREAGEHRRA